MSRLLLVDDELDSMDMIRWAARNAGFAQDQIHVATTRDGALQEIGVNEFSLAVVDIKLLEDLEGPEDPEGGLKVINRLRNEWPDCLIIAVTGARKGEEPLNVTGDKAIKAGANDFLSKLDKATGAAYFSQRLLDRLLFWKGCIGR